MIFATNDIKHLSLIRVEHIHSTAQPIRFICSDTYSTKPTDTRIRGGYGTKPRGGSPGAGLPQGGRPPQQGPRFAPGCGLKICLFAPKTTIRMPPGGRGMPGMMGRPGMGMPGTAGPPMGMPGMTGPAMGG